LGGLLTLDRALEIKVRELLMARHGGALGSRPEQRANMGAQVEVDVAAALQQWHSIFKRTFRPADMSHTVQFNVPGLSEPMNMHR
jgi:hypothetical protein